MCGQMGPRVKLCRAGPRKGVWRDKCASRIFGSVDAVAIRRECENAGIGDLVRTGPTGTNVNDIRAVLITRGGQQAD